MAAYDAAVAGTGVVPDAEAPLVFELASAQDRPARLVLGNRPLVAGRGEAATLEHLELDVPGAVPEGGLDPQRLQNRRLLLQRMRVVSDAARLQAQLEARPLDDFGFRQLRLDVDGGELVLWARTAFGSAEAELSARAYLCAEGMRDVRLTLRGLRVYGFLPVAAPLLARHLLAALGLEPTTSVIHNAAAPELAPCDGLLPILDLTLFGLLPAHGWRLPDVSRVRLAAVSLADKLVMEWAAEPAESSLALPAAAAEEEVARKRLWEAEMLLGAGESARALEAYRQALERAPDDGAARTRVLQILAADEATLDQAAVEADQTLAHAPDDATALLCRAAVLARRGQHDEAATAFERAGEVDEAAGRALEARCARFAAARERLAAGDEAAALDLLERVIDHPGAAELLRERLTAAERWPDLVRVMRRAALGGDAESAPRMHLEIGRIVLERMGDFEQACDELGQAVRLDATDAVAWEELGRARAAAGRTTAALDAVERAIQLHAGRGDRYGEARLNLIAATISEAAGDDATARARLERAALLDPESALPLRRAAAIESRNGNAREAATLLERALARTPGAADRTVILRELALLLAGALDDFPSARLRLTQALALDASAVEMIDELASLAASRGDRSESEALTAWAADLTLDPQQRLQRLLRLRDAARASGNLATLRMVLNQLAELGGGETSAAAQELGELFLQSGDAHTGELAQHLFERLLTARPERTDVPRLKMAEMLARISDQRGDDDATIRHLHLLLDQGPDGALALQTWQRISELHVRRGEIPAAARALVGSAEDARTRQPPAERAAALVAAANLLRRRANQPEDAAGLCERALALAPGCREALDVLQELAAGRNDAEALAGVLERKAAVVSGDELRDLLLELGELEMHRLERPERAHDVYLRVLEVDGASRTALLFLAREAWLRHDVTQARELYGRLASLDQGPPPAPITERAETHLRLATLAGELGHNEESERQVRQTLELVPTSAPALDLLLQLLEARQARRELSEALARRADVEPAAEKRAELLRHRAALLEELGERGRAAETRRDLASVRSSDPAVLVRVARSQHDEGRTEDLEHTLEQLRTACAQAGQPLPDDALLLQADVAERQGRPADALALLVQLASRTQGAGADTALRDVRHRAARLIATARLDSPSARELLEQALQADPADATAADALSWLYLGLPEPQARVRAVSALLATAGGLSAARRAALHAALGELAESAAEPERAEQAYRMAVSLEPDPATRAGYLTARARVLLSRADVEGASTDLENALRLDADHAGALAALADVAFRRQQWEIARGLYVRLEAAPDASAAAPREAVAFRLGLLAQFVGDDAEALRRFREVADLNPRHIEAREAMAQIAVTRRNFAMAAARLEELLRLIPFDDLARLRDVRQRLGEVYWKLGDLVLSRHYLELVVAQDPARVSALELLVDVYERLDQYRKAADTCGRLSQLYLDPSQRAQVLFRQGEILRLHLGKETAALDAYLKSSDLDPGFLPTLERLSGFYWRQGDFENLAEIGAELCSSERQVQSDDPDLAIQIAIATALVSGEPEPAAEVLAGAQRNAAATARALAAATGHLDGRPAHEIEPAVSALFAWGGESFADQVAAELADIAAVDPSAAGPMRALAWVCDRAGRNETARALYSLLAFVHRDQGSIGRLIEMGPAPPPRPEALAQGSPAAHPSCAGNLARVLGALAAPLEGFAWQEPDPAPAASPPGEETAGMLRHLMSTLATPPVTPAVRDLPGDDPVLFIEPSRPVRLVLNRAAEALPSGELLFLCARLLDLTRAGVTSLAQCAPEEAWAALSGAAAALAGTAPPEAPMAQALAAYLAAAADRPTGTAADELAAELQSVLAAPPDWDACLAGAQHTANRIALLTCGNPLGAWRALARFEGWRASDDDSDSELRIELARTSEAFLELLRFVVSPDYDPSFEIV